MAFWNVDLTTQDGALGATQNGGVACFVAGGLTVLGIGLLVMTAQPTTPPGEFGAAIVAMIVEALVFVVAGFRLRAGKGMIWGGVAALLLVVELLTKLTSLSGIGGAVISAILLMVIVNGVRGARALRSGALDGDAIGEVFE